MSETRKCSDCVHSQFDHAYGLQVCGKYNVPVNAPNLPSRDPDMLGKSIAKNCDAFTTNPLDAVNSARSPEALMIGFAPEIQASALAAPQAERVVPPTCKACRFYAPPHEVGKTYGFPVGMCVVNGTLLNPERLANAASNCSVGNEGPTNFRAPLEQAVTLLPRFAVLDRKSEAPKGKKSGRQASDHHTRIDPRDWPTDRQVTEREAKFGIKAWRMISDPKGYGADVFMPIVAWDKVIDRKTGERLVPEDPRETYKGSRPELYQDHGGLLYTAAALMMGGFTEAKALNKALTLRGEAGTGKTEFFLHLAYLMDVPFTRISITPATEVYHLEGKDTLVGGPNGETLMKFNMSRFAKAYAKPGVIVVDEWNAGQDEVQFFMRPLIDGVGKFVIESEGIAIERHPLNFLGFTMNPEDNPAYRGTRPLSEADWDRLLVRKVDLPDEDTERLIIRSHVEADGLEIGEGQLDKLMAIASQLRAKYANGELPTPWRMRSQIKVASLLSMFDFEDAFKIAVAERLEDEVAELLLTEVRAIVG